MALEFIYFFFLRTENGKYHVCNCDIFTGHKCHISLMIRSRKREKLSAGNNQLDHVD
jgi:hypothetical protein